MRKSIHIVAALSCILMASVAITSCGDDNEISQEARAELAKYLVDNGIDAIQTASGLYYVVHEQGSDTMATASSTVQARYEGRLLDGTVFDSSEEEAISFALSNVIKGWTEGLQLIGIGGSITLYIPSDLAYGSEGRGSIITPNSNLIFDVDIEDVDGLRARAVREAQETQQILAFISDNDLDPIVTDEGVYIQIDDAGGDEKPTAESTVTLHYFGARLDGQQIDSSYDRGKPSDLDLGDVIEGWRIAIPYFGRGGSGTIIIPSALAYGAERRPGIPPHTALYFTIEVIDF